MNENNSFFMLLLYLLLFDIELLITSQLQSYDIISKVVSLAYGKFLNEKKSETATNQRVIKNHLLDPMENFRYRYGKRAKKWLLLKKKSAKKQSPAAGIVSHWGQDIT